MSLFEQISADVTAALKAGDKTKREVLSLVKSALTNYKIAQKLDELKDEDVIKVLSKELKGRKEAAVAFKKGGADDRAAQEEAEAKILEAYLPEQMSAAEVEKKVDEIIAKTGAKSAQDMGKVMGAVSQELKGKADMGQVNALVKDKLAK